jgi:polyphosphate kinase
MEIQEEEADDLMLTMEENLRQRHFGSVVRLEIDDSMPKTCAPNFDVQFAGGQL